jgi:hypothetical protein
MRTTTSLPTIPVLLLGCAVWIVLAYTDPASAQIQFGAKAGISFTNFLGDSDPEFEQKTNFSGGFSFRHEMNRNASFQPELLYVVKGSKTQTEIDGIDANLSFSITYLEVPALFRYSLNPRSGVSPVIAAGPVASWNIDSRVRFSAVGSDVEFTESDDSIKQFDFGVAAEVGADFRWDLRTISVGVRYTYGVSNLVDNPDDPKHNGALSLSAGIGL